MVCYLRSGGYACWSGKARTVQRWRRSKGDSEFRPWIEQSPREQPASIVFQVVRLKYLPTPTAFASLPIEYYDEYSHCVPILRCRPVLPCRQAPAQA